MSNSVSLTDRERAVVVQVFEHITIPTISGAQWAEIAKDAGIDNGDTARNARFAFNSAKKKLGIGAGGEGAAAAAVTETAKKAPAPKGGKAGAKGKRGRDDEEDREAAGTGADGDAAAGGLSEGIKSRVGKRAASNKKKIKVEDFDSEDEEGDEEYEGQEDDEDGE